MRHCEVVIPRSSGGDLVIPFDVADDASDTAIRDAANRAIEERYVGTNGLANRDVNYTVYIDSNPASAGARGAGDHMLFMRGGALVRENARTTRPTGTSPLTYHVPWRAGQSLLATAMNNETIDSDPTQTGTQPLATLTNLRYTSDGVAGLNAEEARSFIASFESKFGSDEAGRARLRHVLDQDPTFDFGPDGNSRLSAIYERAGIRPPNALARPETGAVDPNAPNPSGAPAGDLTASQIMSGTIDFSGLEENDRRCLAELRRLIMQLLQGGDPDILLAAIMNVNSRMSKNGMARAGVMVSRAMERIQQQIRTNSDRIAEIQGSGHTGAQAGRDAGELTRLQTANQTLQSNLQMLSRVLQSFTEVSQEASEMARNATEFHTRQSRYMAWS